MSAALHLLLMQSIMYFTCTGWFLLEPNMPSGNVYSAAGFFNESIWIIGGFYSTEIYEYRVEIGAFITEPSPFPSVSACYAQCWTQSEELIYIIEDSSTLGIFNMRNKSYTTDWKGLTMKTVHSTACLALSVSANLLFVVGGSADAEGYDNSYNTLQILNISSYKWLNNTPSMQQERARHACLVHSNQLWAFGGIHSIYLETNERIDITDFNTNAWEYVDPLSIAADGLRAITVMDMIYIIGGWYNGESISAVHIMNPISGRITLSNDSLPYGISYTSPVLAQSTLYLFGGFWGNNLQPSNGVVYNILNNTPYSIAQTSESTISEQTTEYLETVSTLYPGLDPTTDPISSEITTFGPTLDTESVTEVSTQRMTNIVYKTSYIVSSNILSTTKIDVLLYTLIIGMSVLILLLILLVIFIGYFYSKQKPLQKDVDRRLSEKGKPLDEMKITVEGGENNVDGIVINGESADEEGPEYVTTKKSDKYMKTKKKTRITSENHNNEVSLVEMEMTIEGGENHADDVDHKQTKGSLDDLNEYGNNSNIGDGEFIIESDET